MLKYQEFEPNAYIDCKYDCIFVLQVETMKKRSVITTISSAIVLSWVVAGYRLFADIETPMLESANFNLYDFQFNYIFTYLFL